MAGCDQRHICDDYLPRVRAALDRLEAGLREKGRKDAQGYCDLAETCGPLWWGVLHAAAEAIGCSHCQSEAVKMVRALHDLKNRELGLPQQAPADFAWLLAKMQAAVGIPSGARPLGAGDSLLADPRRWFHGPDAQHQAAASPAHCRGIEQAPSQGAHRCGDPAGGPDAGRSCGVPSRPGRGPGREPARKLAIACRAQSRRRLIVLDTTILSALLIPGHEDAPTYKPFLAAYELATTEHHRREFLATRRVSQRTWVTIMRASNEVQVLPQHPDAAEYFDALREMLPGHISNVDVWGAAFAVAYNFPIVTNDRDLAFALVERFTVDGRQLEVYSRFLGNLGQAHALPAVSTVKRFLRGAVDWDRLPKDHEIGASLCQRKDGSLRLGKWVEGDHLSVTVPLRCGRDEPLGITHTHPADAMDLLSPQDRASARMAGAYNCALHTGTRSIKCATP